LQVLVQRLRRVKTEPFIAHVSKLATTATTCAKSARASQERHASLFKAPQSTLSPEQIVSTTLIGTPRIAASSNCDDAMRSFVAPLSSMPD
jgi:hypothetical protein